MSPLIWIAAITWAVCGLAGLVQFGIFSLVDPGVQRGISYKLAHNHVKTVPAHMLALVTIGVTIVAVPCAILGGPFVLAWVSNLLEQSVEQRLEIERV